MFFSFHNSVSYVGSHEPTSSSDRSLIDQIPFCISLQIATETRLFLSASLKIIATDEELPVFHVMICGLDIGIRLVPAPLRLKEVVRKPELVANHCPPFLCIK